MIEHKEGCIHTCSIEQEFSCEQSVPCSKVGIQEQMPLVTCYMRSHRDLWVSNDRHNLDFSYVCIELFVAGRMMLHVSVGTEIHPNSKSFRGFLIAGVHTHVTKLEHRHMRMSQEGRGIAVLITPTPPWLTQMFVP